MSMSTYYVGTISEKDSEHYPRGFISLKTLRRLDGTDHGLDTKSDVFFHYDDRQEYKIEIDDFEVGKQVIFRLEEDPKRKKAFRACSIKKCVYAPVRDGIEIHFDQRSLDHPVIPIRWCIKPDLWQEISQNLRKSRWYIAIVAQPVTKVAGKNGHFNDNHTVFQTIIGLKDISLGHGYIELKAAGDYDVVTYLVQSRLTTEDLITNHRNFDSRKIDVWRDVSTGELGVERETSQLYFLEDSDYETVRALSHTVVSAPAEIFAKPISEGLQNWLAYFGLHRPKDECSMRWRLPLVFILGPVGYLLKEGATRLWLLILGFFHYLFGGNPMPVWKRAFTRKLAAYCDWPVCEFDYEEISLYEKGWFQLLDPRVYLCLSFAILLFVEFDWFRWIVGVFAFIVTAVFVADHFFPELFRSKPLKEETQEEREERKERERAQKREQERLLEEEKEARARKKYAATLAQGKQLAMCASESGVPIPPVKKPKSIKLFWTGIKRRVCRTYSW